MQKRRKEISTVKGLVCRECGRQYPVKPIHICEYCFGPLEVQYDYEKIAKTLTRNMIEKRPPNMWRYRELLPIDGSPTVGYEVGFTPLIKAKNLSEKLGVKEVYIKDDAVNYPTLSFKDRVVSVAISKAKEFNFSVVACASTGNLANSVAALAAKAGYESYIFIPCDLETSKIIGTTVYGAHLIGIKGNYDKVNRLCSEIAGRYNWAFVNINIRPFYSEGSKTFAFEIAEQLGWRVPDHIVVPMAGGSLITKIWKAFKEFEKLGFVEKVKTKVHGAQASGCAPIVEAVKEGLELFRPVQNPKTIAKSLAIGNPADGYYATKSIRESGGWAEDATDEEIVEGIRLLAETEGIFTETAGGVVMAATLKLVKSGIIKSDETLVISITGNGLKTQEVLTSKLVEFPVIEPKISDFDELMQNSGR
jgi:threonine synthase